MALKLQERDKRWGGKRRTTGRMEH